MTNIDTALNKQQHAFLQALMARGVMPEKAAVKMYAEMLDLDMAEANKLFSRFWSPIASALGYLDLDIRVIRYQEDQQLYMGVVNKTGGEAAKLATRLTPEQIALFRMVLDEILRDDTSVERGVDVISALNATQAAPTTQVRDPSFNPFKTLAPRWALALGARTCSRRSSVPSTIHSDSPTCYIHRARRRTGACRRRRRRAWLR